MEKSDIHLLTVDDGGGITLPAELQKYLEVKAGGKILLYRSGDSIMLKKVHDPSEFAKMEL